MAIGVVLVLAGIVVYFITNGGWLFYGAIIVGLYCDCIRTKWRQAKNQRRLMHDQIQRTPRAIMILYRRCAQNNCFFRLLVIKMPPAK